MCSLQLRLGAGNLHDCCCFVWAKLKQKQVGLQVGCSALGLVRIGLGSTPVEAGGTAGRLHFGWLIVIRMCLDSTTAEAGGVAQAGAGGSDRLLVSKWRQPAACLLFATAA